MNFSVKLLRASELQLSSKIWYGFCWVLCRPRVLLALSDHQGGFPHGQKRLHIAH